MPPSKGSIAALIFGGISLLSILGLGYYFFFLRSPKQLTLKDIEAASPRGNTKAPAAQSESDDDEEDDEEVEEGQAGEEEDAGERGAVAAEDVESDEEEARVAEEQETEQRRQEELKAKYDDAIRVAAKLHNGNAFLRAADKYKEAIKLAEDLHSVSTKDLIVLYNNCSAMFEKAGQFAESLLDINVILQMDGKHIKARVRRARIFEAQGKLRDALNDYVLAMLVEQATTGKSSYTEPIESLGKIYASQEAMKIVQRLLSSEPRPLPSHSHISSFLESCPSTFKWRAQFKDASRDTFVSAIPAALVVDESNNVAVVKDAFARRLELVAFDIANGAYDSAFKSVESQALQTMYSSLEDATLVSSTEAGVDEGLLHLFSLYNELRATAAHLRCHLPQAMEWYRLAISQNSLAVDAHIKLAMVNLELGELSEVERMFDDLLIALDGKKNSFAQFCLKAISRLSHTLAELEFGSLAVAVEDMVQSPAAATEGSVEDTVANAVASPEEVLAPPMDSEFAHRALKAWVLSHRSSLWVGKDSTGQYRPEGLAKCVADIEEGLTLTDFVSASSRLTKQDLGDVVWEMARGARFNLQLKVLYALSHTKPQMGLSPEESDKEKIQECIADVKRIYPDHKTILMLEADLIASNGDMDGALSLIDRAIAAEPDSSMPLVVRANILTQKALMEVNITHDADSFRKAISEVEDLYKRAMEVEPLAQEAPVNFAQMKSFMGEIQEALSLIDRAIPLIRSRDEALDVAQLMVMTKAQFAAVQELNSLK